MLEISIVPSLVVPRASYGQRLWRIGCIDELSQHHGPVAGGGGGHGDGVVVLDVVKGTSHD